jgi:hypothetical protein
LQVIMIATRTMELLVKPPREEPCTIPKLHPGSLNRLDRFGHATPIASARRPLITDHCRLTTVLSPLLRRLCGLPQSYDDFADTSGSNPMKTPNFGKQSGLFSFSERHQRGHATEDCTALPCTDPGKRLPSAHTSGSSTPAQLGNFRSRSLQTSKPQHPRSTIPR